MQRSQILLGLGVWIAILPYLGFPHTWKDTLTLLSGIFLIYLSYMMYRESKAKNTKTEIFENFRENKFEGESKEF